MYDSWCRGRGGLQDLSWKWHGPPGVLPGLTDCAASIGYWTRDEQGIGRTRSILVHVLLLLLIYLFIASYVYILLLGDGDVTVLR